MRAAAIAAACAVIAFHVTQTPSTSAPISLRDVAPSSGVTFRLENHPTPAKRLIETMPGGLAAFDYNNDGRADLYFTNGAAATSETNKPAASWNRLYRNDGAFKFTDVTAQAGVAGEGFSMGAAAADFDNDGDVDVFVAGFERNLLYRNTGKGTFENITPQSGIQSRMWSVAAGWLDFDRDGLLDLFVVNYLKWSASGDRFCGDRTRNIRVYCHPKYYDGLPNTLYRNRGNGTFEDVSEKSGIASHVGKGMSLGLADYDADGWLDVFVTNDTLPNFLFRNLGNGRFEETALLSGAGVSINGKAISSMGVVFGDVDNDGRPDLQVTALAGETFPLFRNEGKGQFSDQTAPSGLGRATQRRSGWGNTLADLDNDGWKDLFTANSHVNDRIEEFEAHRYRESNGVFRNTGDGRFVDISDQMGTDFQTPRAHRGAIAVDLDNDGRLDIVTSSLGDRPEIWQNQSAGGNRWLALRLTGTKSNRDGIGARIRVGNQMQIVATADGYSSSVHAPVHFGLAAQQRVDSVEIVWPNGTKQMLKDIATNQVLAVKEP